MTIQEENHHSLILIEHDPLLYEDAREMAEYISHALRDAAQEAAVLLYASGIDPYFEDGPRETLRMGGRAHPRAHGTQTSLEAFS